MDILKRIGCRVLAPLLFTVAGLLMIVVVPMNASQFLLEEGAEEVRSESEVPELHQSDGLIYNKLTKDADSSNSTSLKTSLSR